MSLIEELRLRLDVCDRARAFYSAVCHLEQNDPEVIKLVAALGESVKALDAYENPPAKECVQEIAPDPSAPLIALIRNSLASCPIGAGCHACAADRARLVELGEFQ